MAAEFDKPVRRTHRHGQGRSLAHRLVLLTFAGLFSAALAHAQVASDAQQDRAQSSEEVSVFREAAGPLGLSEEQIERLEAISEESSSQATVIRAELRAVRSDLHALLAQDEPDLVAVMTIADEIGVQETRMRKHHLLALLSMRALLSHEQRENLMPVLQEIGERKRAATAANSAQAAESAETSNPASRPTAQAVTQP